MGFGRSTLEREREKSRNSKGIDERSMDQKSGIGGFVSDTGLSEYVLL